MAVGSGVNRVTIYRRRVTVEALALALALALDVGVDDADRHSPLAVTGDLQAEHLDLVLAPSR